MEKKLMAHEHEMLRASVECKVKDWSLALRLNQGEIDEMIEKGIDYAYENLVNYNPKQSKLPTYVAYITSRNLPKWVRDMRNRIRLHHDVKHCEQLSRRVSGLDRKATYRYVFETGLACVCACAGERAGVPAGVRMPPRERDLNSNSNLSTNRVCGTSAAEAATHTQPISLGGLLRSLPKRVPESYALWWWRHMKDREWQLNNLDAPLVEGGAHLPRQICRVTANPQRILHVRKQFHVERRIHISIRRRQPFSLLPPS